MISQNTTRHSDCFRLLPLRKPDSKSHFLLHNKQGEDVFSSIRAEYRPSLHLSQDRNTSRKGLPSLETGSLVWCIGEEWSEFFQLYVQFSPPNLSRYPKQVSLLAE